MSTARREYRGSRKHILDWVGRPQFRSELEMLIGIEACRIPATAELAPRGHDRATEARLDATSGRAFCDPRVADELRRWWLAFPRRANTPNWDLIVQCELDGQPGLVLVEAKANATEFSRSGKKAPSRTLRDGTPRTEASYQASHANHERISAAIEEARAALTSQLRGVCIGRNCAYQLSNRVAFAWKLGSNGWRYFSGEEAMAFCDALRAMFRLIDGNRGSEAS